MKGEPDVSKPQLKLGLDKFSGLYLWALFILVFAIWTPSLFLTSSTVHSLASQQAVSAMLAIALLFPIAAGAFDLSIGSTINLSTILVISLQTTHHWSMETAIPFTILCCAFIGFVNGFIVVKLHVSSFIATLGTGTILAAVQSIVTGDGQPLPPTSSSWLNLTQHKIFGFQSVVLYLIVIALIAWWVLDFTPMGRYLYAIGGNAEASRLSGVAVGRWTWLSLIISASISGVAGIFYGSLFGPSLTFGGSLMLPAFAAVFLGSTQFKPGRFNIWGTLLAVYVLATGVKGLLLVTGVQWLNDMFSGVALIVAVSFATWRQLRGSGRRAAKRITPEKTEPDTRPRPSDAPDVPAEASVR